MSNNKFPSSEAARFTFSWDTIPWTKSLSFNKLLSRLYILKFFKVIYFANGKKVKVWEAKGEHLLYLSDVVLNCWEQLRNQLWKKAHWTLYPESEWITWFFYEWFAVYFHSFRTHFPGEHAYQSDWCTRLEKL